MKGMKGDNRYLSMKEGCVFVLFVVLRSPKSHQLCPHSCYCLKALDD